MISMCRPEAVTRSFRVCSFRRELKALYRSDAHTRRSLDRDDWLSRVLWPAGARLVWDASWPCVCICRAGKVLDLDDNGERKVNLDDVDCWELLQEAGLAEVFRAKE